MEEQRRTENQKRKEYAILENENKKKEQKLRRLQNKTQTRTLKTILPFLKNIKLLSKPFKRKTKTTIFIHIFFLNFSKYSLGLW